MKNILRLAAPNLFYKEPIPQIMHPGLLKAIDEVRKSRDVGAAMQKALDILNTKYASKRLQTYVRYPRMLETDPNKLWERSGFLHCTQQNYLFRVLMVKSGKLTDNQITFGYSMVWYISPHQYLKIKLSDKTIAIDPWNYHFGATLGKYAAGFGVKEL